LKRFGFPVTIQTFASTIQQYITDVFGLLNRYQYCDIDWFTTLSFNGLKTLYHKIYDIWIYRAGLSDTEKKNIVKDGVVFVNNIDEYTIDMEEKLKKQLLRNIERLVTEGLTEDHRKTGALYVMLGIVQVSAQARDFHPNLFQAVNSNSE
jgi:hypothetical protein